MLGLVYLSVPFTHEDKKVVAWRVEMYHRVQAVLLRQGFHVVSPMDKLGMFEMSDKSVDKFASGLGMDWKYWEEFGENLLNECMKLFVVQLSGWDKSTGVAGEIGFAKQNGIPVVYLDHKWLKKHIRDYENMLNQFKEAA